MTELEVGDVVMCTVERIVGTTVFVKIDGNGEGSIILSEIAPGRIRNLRDYVVPKKVIICKVLRISGDRIDLSLRRVTPKEQKEIRERYKLEKSYNSIFKTVLGEKSDEIIDKIRKESSLYDFVEESKENPIILENLIEKDKAKKILEILKTQKQKRVVIKKEFSMTSIKPNGIKLIKEILTKEKNVQINYVGAGRYTIKTEAIDPKKADNLLTETLKSMEKDAKKLGLEFGIKEK